MCGLSLGKDGEISLETSQIAHCPLLDKEAGLKATASGRLLPEIVPLQTIDVIQKVP